MRKSVIAFGDSLKLCMSRRIELYNESKLSVEEFAKEEQILLSEEVNLLRKIYDFYQNQNETLENKCVSLQKPGPNKVSKEKNVPNGSHKKQVNNKATESKKDQTNNPEKVADINVSRLDFRIGQIKEISQHPDAEKCYIELVDLGEGRLRTVVSGLSGRIPMNELLNRKAMFLCNLKPMNLRGVKSEAMIMCASTDDKIEVLLPPQDCSIGDRVICRGYEGEPDQQLNPKHKVWETIQPKLGVNSSGIVVCDEAPFEIQGKGTITSPSLKGCSVK